jgi:hypothetical protein
MAQAQLNRPFWLQNKKVTCMSALLADYDLQLHVYTLQVGDCTGQVPVFNRQVADNRHQVGDLPGRVRNFCLKVPEQKACVSKQRREVRRYAGAVGNMFS